MSHFKKTSQTRVMVTHLTLTVAATCLPGMAWAGDWTHDSTYGAATVIALPGGQVTLAHDGADLQARTIIYLATNGASTTITRDYGPSGHKAVEVENGTVRQHVYGAGLSPLLRIEGDGSLTYQVGPETINVDATGGTTVAHLVADIKRSSVAVLDAQGQLQQRVAYSTLGQSRGQQQSNSVYVNAGQSRGYEGLSLLLLSTEEGNKELDEELVQDQLTDNRARIYFPLAGRFLALDAAGKALGYEARDNNWITHADYDGNMTGLVKAVKMDRGIVLVIGDDHEELDGIKIIAALIDELEANNVPFRIYQEDNLLFSRDFQEFNPRVKRLGLEARMKKLYDADQLRNLAKNSAAKPLRKSEADLAIKQLVDRETDNSLMLAMTMHQGSYQLQFAPSKFWDISTALEENAEDKFVSILFMGAIHLISPDSYYPNYYDRPKDKIRYRHSIEEKLRISFLQPDSAFNIVSNYKLVGIYSKTKLINKFMEEYINREKFYRKTGYISSLEYEIFTLQSILPHLPALGAVFKSPNGNADEEEKKNENNENNPLLKPQEQNVQQHVGPSNDLKKLMDSAGEEWNPEDYDQKPPGHDQKPHGCGGCLVQ